MKSIKILYYLVGKSAPSSSPQSTKLLILLRILKMKTIGKTRTDRANTPIKRMYSKRIGKPSINHSKTWTIFHSKSKVHSKASSKMFNLSTVSPFSKTISLRSILLSDFRIDYVFSDLSLNEFQILHQRFDEILLMNV